jgi:hypothetical protein
LTTSCHYFLKKFDFDITEHMISPRLPRAFDAGPASMPALAPTIAYERRLHFNAAAYRHRNTDARITMPTIFATLPHTTYPRH